MQSPSASPPPPTPDPLTLDQTDTILTARDEHPGLPWQCGSTTLCRMPFTSSQSVGMGLFVSHQAPTHAGISPTEASLHRSPFLRVGTSSCCLNCWIFILLFCCGGRVGVTFSLPSPFFVCKPCNIQLCQRQERKPKPICGWISLAKP